MSTWSRNKRITYGGSVLILFLGVVLIVGFLTLYNPASCSDGIYNQDELGIDCGGSCSQVCTGDARVLQVLWARALLVSPGTYNAVAYIENQNTGIVSGNFSYTFKLFDANNILVAERQGVSYVSRDGTVPIFESGVQTGNRIPVRTFFEILDAPQWGKAKSEFPTLTIKNRQLSGLESSPRLSARIKNETIDNFNNVEVVATLFDASGNAIAVSKTLIPRLSGQEEKSLVFTWSQPFSDPVAKIDIIPRLPERAGHISTGR